MNPFLCIALCTFVCACLEPMSGATDAARSDAETAAASDAASAPPDTVAPATTAAPDTIGSAPADTIESPPPDTVESPPPDTTTTTCTSPGGVCTANENCCGAQFCTRDPWSYATEGVCADPQPAGAYCVTDAWCAEAHCIDNVCGGIVCQEEGDNCMFQGACCDGMFCSGGPYVYGECMPRQPLGAACQNDNWCAEGSCLDSVCATAGCTEIDRECIEDGDCCTGLCPYNYGPSYCAARAATGSWCAEDRECRSGVCRDYACAERCQDTHEGCWYDSDCCIGLYCTWPVDGALATCEPRHGIGEACEGDNACASGLCRGGECQAEGCLALGIECFWPSECCTGVCSWDAMSYSPGHCIEPQPSGTVCVDDSWCRSGRCIDGACH